MPLPRNHHYSQLFKKAKTTLSTATHRMLETGAWSSSISLGPGSEIRHVKKQTIDVKKKKRPKAGFPGSWCDRDKGKIWQTVQ
ncbi:hypothetical protein RvVAR031_18070 [Agrobacterium vitis]|nr:hypothetical protein RvVAR031_18070 [Agrobacterium vitis]